MDRILGSSNQSSPLVEPDFLVQRIATTNNRDMNKLDAAYIFARAINKRDPEALGRALHPEVTYFSQFAMMPDIVGREEVTEYFRERFVESTEREVPVFAEIGETRRYPMYTLPEEPCVVISQPTQEDLYATVLFEVEDDEIIKFGFCAIPGVHTVWRTGVFPGLAD